MISTTTTQDGSTVMSVEREDPCTCRTCTCSESVSTREVVSWALVCILSVLFTGLLTVLVLQWLVKKRQLNRDTHNKTSKYEMEGNPCYEANQVKQTTDADTHIYEIVIGSGAK